jgi:hypothetical protein
MDGAGQAGFDTLEPANWYNPSGTGNISYNCLGGTLSYNAAKFNTSPYSQSYVEANVHNYVGSHLGGSHIISRLTARLWGSGADGTPVNDVNFYFNLNGADQSSSGPKINWPGGQFPPQGGVLLDPNHTLWVPANATACFAMQATGASVGQAGAGGLCIPAWEWATDYPTGVCQNFGLAIDSYVSARNPPGIGNTYPNALPPFGTLNFVTQSSPPQSIQFATPVGGMWAGLQANVVQDGYTGSSEHDIRSVNTNVLLNATSRPTSGYPLTADMGNQFIQGLKTTNLQNGIYKDPNSTDWIPAGRFIHIDHREKLGDGVTYSGAPDTIRYGSMGSTWHNARPNVSLVGATGGNPFGTSAASYGANWGICISSTMRESAPQSGNATGEAIAIASRAGMFFNMTTLFYATPATNGTGAGRTVDTGAVAVTLHKCDATSTDTLDATPKSMGNQWLYAGVCDASGNCAPGMSRDVSHSDWIPAGWGFTAFYPNMAATSGFSQSSIGFGFRTSDGTGGLGLGL